MFSRFARNSGRSPASRSHSPASPTNNVAASALLRPHTPIRQPPPFSASPKQQAQALLKLGSSSTPHTSPSIRTRRVDRLLSRQPESPPPTRTPRASLVSPSRILDPFGSFDSEITHEQLERSWSQVTAGVDRTHPRAVIAAPVQSAPPSSPGPASHFINSPGSLTSELTGISSLSSLPSADPGSHQVHASKMSSLSMLPSADPASREALASVIAPLSSLPSTENLSESSKGAVAHSKQQDVRADASSPSQRRQVAMHGGDLLSLNLPHPAALVANPGSCSPGGSWAPGMEGSIGAHAAEPDSRHHDATSVDPALPLSSRAKADGSSSMDADDEPARATSHTLLQASTGVRRQSPAGATGSALPAVQPGAQAWAQGMSTGGSGDAAQSLRPISLPSAAAGLPSRAAAGRAASNGTLSSGTPAATRLFRSRPGGMAAAASAMGVLPGGTAASAAEPKDWQEERQVLMSALRAALTDANAQRQQASVLRGDVDAIRKNLQAMAECESGAARLVSSRQAAQAEVTQLALDLRRAKQDAEKAHAEVAVLNTRLAQVQEEAAEVSHRLEQRLAEEKKINESTAEDVRKLRSVALSLISESAAHGQTVNALAKLRAENQRITAAQSMLLERVDMLTGELAKSQELCTQSIRENARLRRFADDDGSSRSPAGQNSKTFGTSGRGHSAAQDHVCGLGDWDGAAHQYTEQAERLRAQLKQAMQRTGSPEWPDAIER